MVAVGRFCARPRCAGALGVVTALLLVQEVLFTAYCLTDCPLYTALQVARATLDVLLRHVPGAVAGIVFLSGGQDQISATKHLAAINLLDVHR